MPETTDHDDVVDRHRRAVRMLVLRVDDRALTYRLNRIKEERDSVFLMSLPTYPLFLDVEELEIEHELARRTQSRRPTRADVPETHRPDKARPPPPRHGTGSLHTRSFVGRWHSTRRPTFSQPSEGDHPLMCEPKNKNTPGFTVVAAEDLGAEILSMLGLGEDPKPSVPGVRWCKSCQMWHADRDKDGKELPPAEQTKNIVEALIGIVAQHGIPTEDHDVEALHQSIAGLRIGIDHEVRTGKISAVEAEASRKDLKRLKDAMATAGFKHTEEDDAKGAEELTVEFLTTVINGILEMEQVLYTKKLGSISNERLEQGIKIVQDMLDLGPYQTQITTPRTAWLYDKLNDAAKRFEVTARDIMTAFQA